MPYLSQTVLTYMLETHFHLHAIDKPRDFRKKTFNFLSFLPPPSSPNDDYSRYMNASRNIEVELFPDQLQEKRSTIKKDVFTKRRQQSIDDVVAFVANILIFARFWIKILDNTSSSYPVCFSFCCFNTIPHLTIHFTPIYLQFLSATNDYTNVYRGCGPYFNRRLRIF